VKVSPETHRAVCKNIIKRYIVTFCWTIIELNELLEYYKKGQTDDNRKQKLSI